MKTNIKNIYLDILELSSIEKQKKYWLNNDPENVSSYVEVMCRLFDDNNFDIFVDKTARQEGISEKVVFELGKLRQLLNDYEEKETDEAIINDPNWKIIIMQAKKVIEEWPNSHDGASIR